MCPKWKNVPTTPNKTKKKKPSELLELSPLLTRTNHRPWKTNQSSTSTHQATCVLALNNNKYQRLLTGNGHLSRNVNFGIDELHIIKIKDILVFVQTRALSQKSRTRKSLTNQACVCVSGEGGYLELDKTKCGFCCVFFFWGGGVNRYGRWTTSNLFVRNKANETNQANALLSNIKANLGFHRYLLQKDTPFDINGSFVFNDPSMLVFFWFKTI